MFVNRGLVKQILVWSCYEVLCSYLKEDVNLRQDRKRCCWENKESDKKYIKQDIF